LFRVWRVVLQWKYIETARDERADRSEDLSLRHTGPYARCFVSLEPAAQCSRLGGARR